MTATDRPSPPLLHRVPASLRVARRALKAPLDLPLTLLDAALAAAAYTSLLIVRYDGDVPSDVVDGFVPFVAVAVVAHIAANWMWRLYGQVWRHAGILEARRLVLSGLTALVILAVLTARDEPRAAPLSVLILGSATAAILMGALRFQARLFAFRRNVDATPGRKVAVFGAGEAGAAIVREILRSPETGLRTVAVLDEDERTRGRSLCGYPVIGGREAIEEAVKVLGAEEILLAIPSADRDLVRDVAQRAERAGVPVRVLPTVHELVHGSIGLRDLRQLEIADLLGRAQVSTDLDAVGALLRGRRVLITGGGGSIGSEIARQVARFGPARLVLLDHDETHLYDTAVELDDRCELVLADIRDRNRVRSLFAEHRPEVVFHAAANKHVPMLERHPGEAVATNIVGTHHVVQAADEIGVEMFVLISTDKAVRPTSVMGASKRIAEQLVLSYAGPGRRYCAVRFGNVLGSRGSVIPRFLRQIERGGPVTVTDPRMTRFFMSIPEAVQLVLQSTVYATGREVFMLDMGEPVPIIDLAHRMIRLAGRRVGTDVPIIVTGVRPGEKLYEELRDPIEGVRPTAHPAIVSLEVPPVDRPALDQAVGSLLEAVEAGADDAVRAGIHQLAEESVHDAAFALAEDPVDVIDLRDGIDGSGSRDPVGSARGTS